MGASGGVDRILSSHRMVGSMTDTGKPGDLKVWWIPQIHGKPFEVPVSTVAEARKLLDVLAKYDAFQFENRIKPDYCNAGGLVVFEDGEWVDWTDEWGDDVDHAPGGRLHVS